MPRTQLTRTACVLAVIGLLAAALLASVSVAAAPKVSITGDGSADYAFAPKTLSISAGATAHWKWDSNARHNVTFEKLGKHSATGASGSYKLKFSKPGTYKYECTVHGFKGKVVVE